MFAYNSDQKEYILDDTSSFGSSQSLLWSMDSVSVEH